MPITPFINGEQFDQETRRVLGGALEMTCLALRTGERVMAELKVSPGLEDRLLEYAAAAEAVSEHGASGAARKHGPSVKKLARKDAMVAPLHPPGCFSREKMRGSAVNALNSAST
jgi:hypothetical protein